MPRLLWNNYRESLVPEFANALDVMFNAIDPRFAVTRGRASIEAQATLYSKYLAGGPLAAKPGRSAHNYGLAIDVAHVLSDGSLSWDIKLPAWAELWAAVKAAPRLHSGHDFPPLAPADDDHIESTLWLEKRAELKAAGTW